MRRKKKILYLSGYLFLNDFSDYYNLNDPDELLAYLKIRLYTSCEDIKFLRKQGKVYWYEGNYYFNKWNIPYMYRKCKVEVKMHKGKIASFRFHPGNKNLIDKEKEKNNKMK